MTIKKITAIIDELQLDAVEIITVDQLFWLHQKSPATADEFNYFEVDHGE